MAKWEFTQHVGVDEVESEDAGHHMVIYSLGARPCPLYVHLLSEAAEPDDPRAHAEIKSLAGHRVRITIERLD